MGGLLPCSQRGISDFASQTSLYALFKKRLGVQEQAENSRGSLNSLVLEWIAELVGYVLREFAD